MSTEKLSELSKPVAYRNKFTGVFHRAIENVLRAVSMDAEPEIYSPAYSQEYVSALDKVAQFWIGESAGWKKRAEDAEKRIAELEAIRSDASQVFKEIGNELGCNPDNESIMMAIDALKEREKRVVALAGGNAELWETMAARLEAAEAQLSTPVQLTEERTLWAGEDDYDTGHVKGWNANRIEQAALLKKQGFTVEGDEQ